MAYELQLLATKLLQNQGFLRAHDQALTAMVRLDERVRRSAPELAAGFKSRCDFYEAQASGRVVHLEDVVLHDANTDVRTPTDEILAASRALIRRRELAKASRAKCADPEYLAKITSLSLTDFLSTDSVASLPDDDESSGHNRELDEALARLDVLSLKSDAGSIALLLREVATLPAFLGGVLLLDHWLYHEGERFTDTGPLLLGAHWKAAGFMTAHSPGIARGLWKARNRWQRHMEFEDRVRNLMAAFTDLAKSGNADLDRLSLAQEVMLNKVPAKGRHVKLREMIAVFVELPLVSNAILMKRLKVTKQAVDYLLSQLGSSLPRELTGRERYRAWGVL